VLRATGKYSRKLNRGAGAIGKGVEHGVGDFRQLHVLRKHMVTGALSAPDLVCPGSTYEIALPSTIVHKCRPLDS
jgi:hypothetical protein